MISPAQGIKQKALPASGDPLLDTVLEPLKPWFQKRGVVEICAVRPGEVRLEREDGTWTVEPAPRLDYVAWQHIAQTLATMDGGVYDEDEGPIVSSRLPGGHRIELMVSERWCDGGGVDVAIRVNREGERPPEAFGLTGDLLDKVRRTVQEGGNTLIVGNTGSGKTTLTKTFIREFIPLDQRLLVAEDTDELVVPHTNAKKYRLKRHGAGAVTYGSVFDHCMRNRPDRLIFGEISIPNAFPFLLFLSSGHSGGLTTLHAQSCRDALEQAFWFRINMAGHSIDKEVLTRFLRTSLDLVVYVERRGKTRQISEVWFVRESDEPQKLGDAA